MTSHRRIMKEFRIFTVLKQASSTVSNIGSIKCRSSINSKKNSEFQMRFESIRTSGQITEGRWVQIPSGFQIFNKTGISVKLDLRKFRCLLIRYLTKYLLIKCINHYKNNILCNKNFKGDSYLLIKKIHKFSQRTVDTVRLDLLL